MAAVPLCIPFLGSWANGTDPPAAHGFFRYPGNCPDCGNFTNIQGFARGHPGTPGRLPAQGRSDPAGAQIHANYRSGCLSQGETVEVKRNRLVYKGLADGAICLDMFILDLDAQHPYPKKIPKATAREGFRLGYGQYQMLTANQKALTLKIMH